MRECIAVVLMAAGLYGVQPHKRMMTVDDLLNLESVCEVELAPNGNYIAYTLKARNGPQKHKIFGATLEVWVAPVSGGQPARLIAGDDELLWHPKWSPDGRLLALESLSTPGEFDGLGSLWVWEASTRKMDKVTDRLSRWGVYPTWLDNRRILVTLTTAEAVLETVPDGNRRDFIAHATREWTNAIGGLQPTSTVFDTLPRATESSDSADRYLQRGLQQLAVVNTDGHVVSLANFDRVQQRVFVSPDGRRVACLIQEMTETDGGVKPFVSIGRWRLAISDTLGKGPPVLSQPMTLDTTQRFYFAWSPSGQMASFTIASQNRDDRVLYRGRAENPFIQTTLPAGAKPAQVVWMDDERLLVRAHDTTQPSPSKSRYDWWLVSDASFRNVTQRFSSPPASLQWNRTSQGVIGVGDGGLWKLSAITQTWTNLTGNTLKQPLTGLSSIQIASQGVTDNVKRTAALGETQAVLAETGSAHAGVPDYVKVDVTSGKSVAVSCGLSIQQRVVAYDVDSETAVCWTGTAAVASDVSVVTSNQARTLVSPNSFMRDVAEGKTSQIQYRTLDGEDATAWVLLPPEYKAERRYPTVTWVYYGDTWASDEAPPHELRTSFTLPLNLQLFAAAGYVVLLPSMPRNKSGEPLASLTNGVLPAVDKLIDLGIADPKRVAVAGHSDGGFSAYGLLATSKRFKVGIALAGPSDWSSYYLSFHDGTRHNSSRRAILDAQSRMVKFIQDKFDGKTLWDDPQRYARNSPVIYANSIEAPVLIIQGDYDYVPLSQGEEMFASLNIIGRTARLVRYSGEGHVVISPANVRDEWRQMYEWLDKYLK